MDTRNPFDANGLAGAAEGLRKMAESLYDGINQGIAKIKNGEMEGLSDEQKAKLKDINMLDLESQMSRLKEKLDELKNPIKKPESK